MKVGLIYSVCTSLHKFALDIIYIPSFYHASQGLRRKTAQILIRRQNVIRTTMLPPSLLLRLKRNAVMLCYAMLLPNHRDKRVLAAWQAKRSPEIVPRPPA